MMTRLLGSTPFTWPPGASSLLLGVDIGTAAIKIVELESTGKGYRLRNFANQRLPPGAVSGEGINDIEAVGAALRAAFRAMKCKIRQAAVAIAGSAVLTRTIPVSADLDESALENHVVIEAEQYIPYSLDEMSIDFVRSRSRTENSELVKVLLAACRREHVDSRVSALQLAGLQARVVDVDAFALARACALLADQTGRPEAQTVAVVDLGASTIVLHVIDNDEVVHLQEHTFGGHALSEAVQSSLGMTLIEAEHCISNGGLPQACVETVLGPFRESLLAQISQLLQAFSASEGAREVGQVLLTGGVASLASLAESCEESLATPVTVVNPFAGMRLGTEVDRQLLADSAPSLVLACGLALRGRS